MQNDRKVNRQAIFIVCIVSGVLAFTWYMKKSYKQDSAHISPNKKSDKELLSELEGYEYWQTRKNFRHFYDIDAFITGLRACEAGEAPPLEQDFSNVWQMMDEVQRETYEKKCADNLQRSVEFLEQIAKKPRITPVIDKQLYYEQLAEGSGTWSVRQDATCLFHYTITSLDGEEIADTRSESQPKKICLDVVISGFRLGVDGMKEGERRKLYIHPDLAYCSTHWLSPPKALLIVDVEAKGCNQCTEGEKSK